MNKSQTLFMGLKSKYSRVTLSWLIVLVILFTLIPFMIIAGYLFVTGLHDYLLHMLPFKEHLNSVAETFNYFIASIMLYLVGFISYTSLIVGLFTTKEQAQKLSAIKTKVYGWYVTVLEHGNPLSK